MNNKKEKRLLKLVTILKSQNGASMKKLAEMLNVSDMTIRRDLQFLSEKKIVNIVHGAAIYNKQIDLSIENKKYILDSEKILQFKEKQAIGRKAVSLINPNDVIIIDTGTTTQFVAKYIPDIPLTVLCYNINILFELKDKKAINLIFSGGYYHDNTQMFQSIEGINLIERTCANKAFVSAAGISNKLGVTCFEQYEVEAKQAIINSSDIKILLADSTKFDKIRPALFAKIQDFDAIITDNGISDDWAESLRDSGVELHIV